MIEDLPVYKYLERHHLQWQNVMDRQLQREYLLVLTEPGDEDDMLGRLMACQLPGDIVYYVYKATT